MEPRAPSERSSSRAYRPFRQSNPPLMRAAIPRSSGRRRYADIMGESVRATTPEMATAPARVRANSRKSEPVRPPWKAMGA